MGESINFEDLFNWQLESDRHYLTMLHQHAEQEYEWQLWEEQERNKRLPALIQVQLIPNLHETKSEPLALRRINQEIL
jgi:hypothetical protein